MKLRTDRWTNGRTDRRMIELLDVCGEPFTRIRTYGVTTNNPSRNFLTIYWIQTQYILLLGEQVLTIFLCIKRVRLNWNLIVNNVHNATYSSHGAPCPTRDLFPWLNTRVKVHNISMDNTQISAMTFSYLSDSGIPPKHCLRPRAKNSGTLQRTACLLMHVPVIYDILRPKGLAYESVL